MTFYRRHLPHLYQPDQPVFLTWRLHNSLPPNRAFPAHSLTSGKAFVAMDRLLEETGTGPFYLRQPAIASTMVEVIQYSADVLGHFTFHAFVVMPNHVHILLSPLIDLPRLTKSLKGYSARQANQILGLTGTRFWQEESYDHLVRDQAEFEGIRRYIEQNPVRAGLATEASEYQWSSAGRAAWRPLADQEVRPT